MIYGYRTAVAKEADANSSIYGASDSDSSSDDESMFGF